MTQAGIRELNHEAFMALHEHMDDIMARLAAVANFVGLDIDEIEEEEDTTRRENSESFTNRNDNDSTQGSVVTAASGIRRVLQEIPKFYLFIALGLVSLYFWGVVALFLIDSHTAKAMAIIMLSLGGFYFLRFSLWWSCANGEEQSYRYWLNRRRRKELRLTLHNDLQSMYQMLC